MFTTGDIEMTFVEMMNYGQFLVPYGYFCFGDDGDVLSGTSLNSLKVQSRIQRRAPLPKRSGTLLNTSSLNFPDDGPLIPRLDKEHICDCFSLQTGLQVDDVAHGFVNIQDLNLVSDPASDVATVVGVQFAPVGFDGYLHIVIDDLHSG